MAQRRRRAAWPQLATLILMIVASSASAADVRVRGDSGALTIDVTNATVGEILSALAVNYDLHYDGSLALGRICSGTYSGTLPNVVARLLGGYNFVLKVSGERVEASILGEPNDSATMAVPTDTISAAAARNSTSEEPTKAPAPSVFAPRYSVASSTPAHSQFQTANLPSMLLTLAQAQLLNSNFSPSAASVPSTPQSSDVAVLTQHTASQLDSLVLALQRLKP